MLVIILINEIHTEAWRLIWLLSFFTLCFSNKKNTMAGNDFIFIFFRTHFTAAWVFLLLRMQNGEKIKDFIFHFHFLTVKVSQMGRISVKFSGCDYLQFFKVVLSLYTYILMVKKGSFCWFLWNAQVHKWWSLKRWWVCKKTRREWVQRRWCFRE